MIILITGPPPEASIKQIICVRYMRLYKRLIDSDVKVSQALQTAEAVG